MGVTIRKKQDGYYLVIQHGGVRKTKKIGPSKALALETKKKVNTRLAIKDLDSPTPTDVVRKANNGREMPSLKQYAERWLEIVAPTSRKRSTIVEYRSHLKKHVYPRMGNRRLDEITPRMISNMIHAMLRKGLMTIMVANVKRTLSAVLQNAMVTDELLSRNPAKEVCVPRFDTEQTKGFKPFTLEERGVLETTFKENYAESYALVAMGFRTGLRINELFGLQWGDIDWQAGTLKVQRNVRRLRVTSIKNKKRRIIRLSSQTVEILKTHRKKVEEVALKNEWLAPPEWVFFGQTGEPVNYFNWLYRTWNKAMSKSGLHRRTPDAMRHSYISQRLSMGHSLAVVAREAGHSPERCLKTYCKYLPADSRANIDALDEKHAIASGNPPDTK